MAVITKSNISWDVTSTRPHGVESHRIAFEMIFTYCDVLPENRDIGARIYDCSRDNGVAKHVSPTTNNNSWERCVTTTEL
jgi:hypothetical protein